MEILLSGNDWQCFIFKAFITFFLKLMFFEILESAYGHNFHCISFRSSAPWLRGQDYMELANSLEEIYL